MLDRTRDLGWQIKKPNFSAGETKPIKSIMGRAKYAERLQKARMPWNPKIIIEVFIVCRVC